ncbi:MAG: hypothetical protein AAGF11_23940 [Myxococcota bacterium]
MIALALAPRSLVLVLLLGSVSACATGDGMQDKLRDATTGYNRSIRWSDFDRAAAYLPDVSKVAFLEHHDEIGERLVIVDYELTRLDLDKSTGIAASRAEISWHTDRRLILESTAVDQLWQWHDGRFVLVDERRSGGAPLAIFAEVGEDPHPYLPGIKVYREVHSIGEDEKTGRRRRRAARRRAQAQAQAPASSPGSANGTVTDSDALTATGSGPATRPTTSAVAIDLPPPRAGVEDRSSTHP